MGFDIVLYDKNDEKTAFLELSEGLHNEIFNDKKLWRSYLELRRINDLYLTDQLYSEARLNTLIEDLKSYQRYISSGYLREYQGFINFISDPSVVKVHISGD